MELATNLELLSAINRETGLLNVVIETPQGCRNKYAYVAGHQTFILKKVLPVGHTFPFDFGFIPSTRGEDGDPLDVLLLNDSPAFPGCIVPARLIGVIEAKQTEKGEKPERNDRLVAVCDPCDMYREIKSLEDLPPHILEQVEQFFISYNLLAGKKFKVVAQRGPKAAMKLVKAGIKKRTG